MVNFKEREYVKWYGGQDRRVSHMGVGMIILFVLMFIVSFMLYGCKREDGLNNEGKKPIKIGYLIDSLVIERWQKDRDIFIAKTKTLGAEVIVKNANEDAALQIEQVKQLVEENVDVIVVIPYDKNSIGPALKAAKKSGVKILSYDRLVLNGGVDVYISFDNIKVGRLMAEEIVKSAPEGKYIVVNGSQKDNNSYMFRQGYMEVLEPYIQKGRIEIIKEEWAEDWRESIAYESVSQVLSSGTLIDAVIGANDDLAEGAIRALLENQLAGEVFVAGHDANLSACQRIVEGTQQCTVYKPIKMLAQRAAEVAVALARGEDVAFTETIHDGNTEVPFIMLDPILVNQDNMVEQIVADGFHLMEEVYRNIAKEKWPK